MYKKILILVMTLILCLPIISASADKTVKQSEETPTSEVSPAYVPEHTCHSGTEHRYCETEYFPEPCGCLYGTYNCCCGLRMEYFYMPCDDHGYSSLMTNGVSIVPVEGEKLDNKDIQDIYQKHTEIKSKIDKAHKSLRNEPQDEEVEKLIKQSNDVLEIINSLKK